MLVVLPFKGFSFYFEKFLSWLAKLPSLAFFKRFFNTTKNNTIYHQQPEIPIASLWSSDFGD
jgi:hypothetical protein